MKFEINKTEWEIIEVDKEKLLEEYKKSVNEEACFAFGLTIFPTHQIWINKDMCFDQQVRTLKHELTHVFIYSYGMFNVPHYTEEMVCDLVASINSFINDVIKEYVYLNK